MPLQLAVIDQGLPTQNDIHFKTHLAFPLHRPSGLCQCEGITSREMQVLAVESESALGK